MTISFGREPSEYEKIVEFVRNQSNETDKVDYDLEQEKIQSQLPKSNISDMSRWLPKGTKVKETKLGDTESFDKWKEDITNGRINEMIKATESESEPKHPDYYKGSNKDGKAIEVFDIIDQFVDGDFYLGNVLKYVCRAGKKSKETKRQDLEKALHYIKEAIKRI